jgi:1,2-diacylglycerol 3-beta-glucosyltransferase
VFTWGQVIIFSFQVLIALMVGYLLLLTVAAFKVDKQARLRPGKPSHRFFILVPAHNEERLLPNLLENLTQLDYPISLYSVHVVADNCSDQTAGIARRYGVCVYERENHEQQGKGFALQWLLGKLPQANGAQDAFVILDADSIISPNFLRIMDARLSNGERAIQAYYAVRDPGRSRNGSLRYAALAVLHYLRPQGRMLLGGSAGLKGNGMAFSADLLKRHPWSASITEDIALHMSLILDGERVTFAPDAVVWGEMPDTLASSASQTQRWESGRLEMLRRYLFPLLRGAWREIKNGNIRQSYLFFDAVMEHIIPPFSVLMGISLALFSISLILFCIARVFNIQLHGWLTISPEQARIAGINLSIGFGLLLGQLVYLLAGLRMVRAPRFIYKRMLYVPVFMVWKFWQFIRMLLGQGQPGWVRTARNGD